MPRWLWWTPLSLLLVGCALVGLRYGWIAATITETDVITHYAQRYLQEHGEGAALSDCMAVPGDNLPGIWIVVRCHPQDLSEKYEYYVNRLGGYECGAWPENRMLLGPRT
jgi:hypothetical protein